MDKIKLGSLLVALSAIGYGTMAIFAKIAYSQGVDTRVMLAGRFALASLIIWGVILLVKIPVKVSLADLRQMSLLSLIGYGGSSTLYFLSLKLLPASLASILFYTYPVMVTLNELWLYHHKLTRAKGTALLLSTVGLVLILGTTFKGVNLTGVLAGFAAAVAYSAYLLYGNKVVIRARPPLVTTGYMLTFAAVGFILYALLTGSMKFGLSPAGWGSITGLAVFSTALAVLALFTGMQWIEAGRAAIISTLEPIFTVVCAAVLFAESITPLQMLGGFLVLLAIVILEIEQNGNPGTSRPAEAADPVED